MKNKPLLIGITGGIGSGKSTVCRMFQLLGVPVYNADDRAKYLTVFDQKLKQSIIAAFGEAAYDGDALNRTYMARQVFADKEKLAKLNSLIHPRVAEDFNDWVTANNDQPYLLKEAALIFETRGNLKLDKVITVTASEKTRIERVLQRDKHRTTADVHKIISNQLPEQTKVDLSDFVIENDGEHMVIPQVLVIHKGLTVLSQNQAT